MCMYFFYDISDVVVLPLICRCIIGYDQIFAGEIAAPGRYHSISNHGVVKFGIRIRLFPWSTVCCIVPGYFLFNPIFCDSKERTDAGQVLINSIPKKEKQRVAKKSGISSSMLSQIDSSIVSPSVNTLFALCNTMGMDMTNLMKSINRTNPIRIYHPEERS